jgi:hypothetical protein
VRKDAKRVLKDYANAVEDFNRDVEDQVYMS